MQKRKQNVLHLKNEGRPKIHQKQNINIEMKKKPDISSQNKYMDKAERQKRHEMRWIS